MSKSAIASENIMTKKLLRITGVALCCVAAAYYASNNPDHGQVWGATPDASGYNQDYSDATLAKVTPGETTKAQVEALLGQPWRTTVFAEIGEDEPGHEAPEVWEWRGQDSQNGLYRVHIEFNQKGIVTNIAKVPEKTGIAPARVAPEETPDAQLRTQSEAPNATPQVTAYIPPLLAIDAWPPLYREVRAIYDVANFPATSPTSGTARIR